MNLISGKLGASEAIADEGYRLPFDAALGAGLDGRPLTFGIRPEDLFLESGAPGEARVHDVENHGVEKIVTLRTGEKLIHATLPARVELTLDEQVRFSWNPEKVVLFDGGSGVSLRHAG